MNRKIFIKKIGYYVHSLLKLLFNMKNPWALVSYVLMPSKEVVLRFRNGVELITTHPLDALIAKETLLDDVYKMKELKDPKKIIDVGGAMGDSAIFVAGLFQNAKVIVFEPNLLSFDILQRNISLNAKNGHIKKSQIEAIQAAVGTQPSYTFYIAHSNVGSSTINDKTNKNKVTVKGVQLDSFVKGGVDLLKIDTEGGEVDILESIAPTSFNKIEHVVCEYHRHFVENQDVKIKEILEKNGYTTVQSPDPYNSDLGYIFATRTKV